LKSALMKPQGIFFFCLLSGIFILILPFASVNITTTYIFGLQNIVTQPHNLNVVDVLSAHKETASSFYTEVGFKSEGTQSEWDLLTATARGAIITVPLVILILLGATWRHLSRVLKYRFVLLVITSTCVCILIMALLGPTMIIGPPMSEIVVNEVGYKWVTLILMIIFFLVGIGSSVYFIFSGEQKNSSP